MKQIAECVKEAYPDHNAWDSSHPYFDPKSDASKPTWMMVDVEFKSRLNFLVGLKLLQVLSQLNDVPACISTYLTQEHLKAIKTMPLLSRARLSVQTTSTVVSSKVHLSNTTWFQNYWQLDSQAYDAVILLGTHGGWEELLAKKIEEKKVAVKAEKKEKRSTPLKKKSKKGKQVVKEEEIDAEEEEEESVQDDEEEVEEKKSVAKKVVKVKQEIKDEIETPDNRRSKRLKKV